MVEVSEADGRFFVRKKREELSCLRFLKENLELVLDGKEAHAEEVLSLLVSTRPDLEQEAKEDRVKDKALFAYYRIVIADLEKEIGVTEAALNQYKSRYSSSESRSFSQLS
ncbi:MAG: hypothetical protein KC422_24545 [Trueperaceae bacterium]|nr:hypothetical protein [Trueperaceae bacterium]